jgi:DNA-binding MarR family transcriptional regulator
MSPENEFHIAGKVVKLGNVVTWLRNRITQSYGLTSSQSDVIGFVLRNADRQITAGEIMEHSVLSQSTVAGILQRLESKGFITRSVHESDSRKSVIFPTALGHQLRKSLRETAIQTQQQMLRGMTAEEQAQLSHLLQKVLDNMNSVRQKEMGDNRE